MLKIRSLPGADPPRHGDPHLGADAKFPGRRSRRAARTTFTAGKKSIIDTKSVFNHARSAKQIVQGHTYANGAKSDNSGGKRKEDEVRLPSEMLCRFGYRVG